MDTSDTIGFVICLSLAGICGLIFLCMCALSCDSTDTEDQSRETMISNMKGRCIALQAFVFAGLFGGMAIVFTLEGHIIGKFIGFGTIVVVFAACYKAQGRYIEQLGLDVGLSLIHI